MLYLNCLSLDLKNSINPETGFQTNSQDPGSEGTVLGAAHLKSPSG